MKTKELIKILNELDPEGNEEVCVGNQDIHFVSMEPAYWDGRLKVLIRDESNTKCYNIIGIKEISTGVKLQIHTLTLEDVLLDNWDDPDLIIEGSERFLERAKELKEENRLMDIDIAKNFFWKYVEKKYPDAYLSEDYVRDVYSAAVNDLFKTELESIKENPERNENGYLVYPSWVSRMERLWDSKVTLENGCLVIKQNE